MPGAPDGWGQLTEPGMREREAAHNDLPRGADRPERGSLTDLRQRLDRLPPGHPSSPYNDDLTRKPPVARLKDLELPFHDTNGAPRHHDAEPGADAPAGSAGGNGSGGNGSGGNGPGGGTGSATADPGAFGTADTEFTAASEFTADTEFTAASEFTAANGIANGFRPPDQFRAGDEFGGTAAPDESGADDGCGPPGPLAESDNAVAGGYGAAGIDGPDPLTGTQGWLSASTWDGQAGLVRDPDPGAPSGWDWAGPGDLEPAGSGTDGEPGWTEPEPAAGPPARPLIDPERHRVDERPRTGPDGSWQWHGRYLTPGEYQIAEKALGRCRIAEGRNVFGGYGHSGLTPAMRRIEAQLESGELLPDTENRALKPPDSFRERFADLILRHPDKPADELSLEVHDGIRYAFIFDAENYAEATLQAHSRLKGHGFDLEARWNGWESREYKGINSRWRDPAHDLVFEVQFHTASSWDAWQRAHSSYKQITDPSTPPAERARLRARQAEDSARVPVPPRCAAIPDYRKDAA
jgi:hypothetical protein